MLPPSAHPSPGPDTPHRIVVVGGVAGGMSAAARARRLDEHASIVVLERSDHVSWAGCGLPYYLSGEVQHRDDLLLHTPETLRAALDLDVRTRTEAVAVDRERRTVTVVRDGTVDEIAYDALLLAPGATSVLPPVDGIDHPAVGTLRSVPDLDAALARLATVEHDGRPVRAVVVGAGFIGLEAVEALVARGADVALVEVADQVLPPLEPDLAPLLAAELREHGVGLHLGTAVRAVVDRPGAPHAVDVELADGTVLPADLVLVSAGVRPASELAAAAGLALGERGAIRVDADQRTSDPHVWAVGDAVEVVHAVTGARGPVPLAGPANRQGRRAADSMLGRRTTPQAPVLGTAVVRVLGLTAAVTGASHAALDAAGVAHEQVRVHTPHHAGWFPGAEPVHVTASFAPDGRFLGAQAVGRTGVDKRIDVLATALRAGMTADDLAELELAYAPPYGSAKDVVNMLGFVAQNVLDGTMPQWHAADLDDVLATSLVLDVRSRAEHAAGHVDGALNVPHTELRGRLDEVRDAADGRPVAVHCASGVRSALATRVLLAAGLDARNLSGGWLTLASTPSAARVLEGARA
ncbi:FAD-dependent oxidoreductase [Cellulosimicrobium marinum]|uniref:FAD-dependent oxidoreductase n=1 Tax=Cellulosimicrobium marinum TaxID=1638992 RepID=UPI001E2C2F61|nr:FAD-dependent oxidoreductase [Cellulosimicrobium marinum]MCB7137300.1 FAD-dependent oxidoreductase [Cellulosimicrobium marinum]